MASKLILAFTISLCAVSTGEACDFAKIACRCGADIIVPHCSAKLAGETDPCKLAQGMVACYPSECQTGATQAAFTAAEATAKTACAGTGGNAGAVCDFAKIGTCSAKLAGETDPCKYALGVVACYPSECQTFTGSRCGGMSCVSALAAANATAKTACAPPPACDMAPVNACRGKIKASQDQCELAWESVACYPPACKTAAAIAAKPKFGQRANSFGSAENDETRECGGNKVCQEGCQSRNASGCNMVKVATCSAKLVGETNPCKLAQGAVACYPSACKSVFNRRWMAAEAAVSTKWKDRFGAACGTAGVDPAVQETQLKCLSEGTPSEGGSSQSLCEGAGECTLIGGESTFTKVPAAVEEIVSTQLLGMLGSWGDLTIDAIKAKGINLDKIFADVSAGICFPRSLLVNGDFWGGSNRCLLQSQATCGVTTFGCAWFGAQDTTGLAMPDMTKITALIAKIPDGIPR